jgi:VanZ family protein
MFAKSYRWLPSLCWMGVIFYLSSRSGTELQGMFPFFDSFNFGHFFAFFILALLYYWALFPCEARIKMDIRLLAVLLSALYGISDEFHQSFIPNRTPDVLDIVNDGLGAASAMLLLTWMRHRLGRRLGNKC